jgi:hypothetical protein
MFTLSIITLFHFRIICNKMAIRIYEIVTKFVIIRIIPARIPVHPLTLS